MGGRSASRDWEVSVKWVGVTERVREGEVCKGMRESGDVSVVGLRCGRVK